MLSSEDAFYESKDITGVSFKYCDVNSLVNINYNYQSVPVTGTTPTHKAKYFYNILLSFYNLGL